MAINPEAYKNITLHIWIDNKSDLFRAFEILQKEKVIGVDLESDSMFHYKEKVCLIQISVPDLTLLIDTLSIKDLDLLLPIFSDPDIRKVFHGADYDIRSLFRDFNIEINSLFDTQLAARFLGITQTGLSSLLQSRFNVTIEKKYQKSDWSRRPLSGKMLQYAIQDTCLLIPLSRMLEKELRDKGRISWFEEECELLSKVRPSPPRDEPLFLRFRGASKLDPRSLALLDEILKWREELALMKDIPPFKILGNEQIMDIVNKKPTSLDGLNSLSMKQISTLGRSLLKATHAAMEMPEDELPVYPKKKRQRQRIGTLRKINVLKQWREGYGKKMGLDPSLICTNSLIEAIALIHKCSPEELKRLGEIKNWQIDLFGEEICDLLTSIGEAKK